MKISSRLRALFRREKLDRDMSEEMRLHLELQAAEHERRGLSPQEARHSAQRTFGGEEQIKERCRDQRSLGWLEDFVRDLRHSARALRKATGFTAAVVLMLSLGIGLVTAIVNIAQPVLLPAIPFPEPDSLVFLGERRQDNGDRFGLSVPRYQNYVDRSSAFAAIGAERFSRVNLLAEGDPRPVGISQVTSGFFAALNVNVAQGRLFAPEEYEAARAGESVVLSHAAWTRYFGQSSEVLGSDIRLDGKMRRVIGILRPDFRTELLLDNRDGIYLATPSRLDGVNNLVALARLKPGLTVARAEGELALVRPPVPAGASVFLAQLRPTLTPVADAFRRDRATPFRVLLGAAAALHLIGCTAVANLMFARTATRRRELGVRLAMGGSRRRVMMLIMSEALLLAGLSAAGGVILATWAQNTMSVLAPAGMEAAQMLEHAAWGRTLWLAVMMSVVTCLVSAAIPAWRSGKIGLNEALKEGAGSLGDSRRLSTLRGVFVVLQAGQAVILLTGVGLLIKTVHQLTRIDLGFVPENRLVVGGNRPFVPGSPAKTALDAEIEARLAALPGVAAVTQASSVPAQAGFTSQGMVMIDGTNPLVKVDCAFFSVSSSYFDVMGMSLLAGQSFTAFRPGDRPIAIISQGMARRQFGNTNPIGKILLRNSKPIEIVGVTRDVVMTTPYAGRLQGSSGTDNQVYFPIWQVSSALPWFGAVLQLQGPMDATLMQQVRKIFAELDPTTVVTLRTLDEVIGGWSKQQRQTLLILQVLSVLALAFAFFGIFSVTAYTVTQRRRELGIRIALGATPARLMGFVLQRGLALGALGVVVGLAGAAALSRILGALLFETNAYDPLVYASVGALLFVATALACWLPARRAARVDPLTALRAE